MERGHEVVLEAEGVDMQVVFNPRTKPPRWAKRNVLWIYSGVHQVKPAIIDRYDAIFAGSHKIAAMCRSAGYTRPIEVVYAASGKPLYTGPLPCERAAFDYDVTFVGNRRAPNRDRPCLAALWDGGSLETFRRGIWGLRREGLDPSRYSSDYFPHEQLAALYPASLVSLNDHYVSHDALNLLPFRVVDAFRCGGFIISTPNGGLDDVFGEGVVPQFTSPGHLHELLHYYMDHVAARNEIVRYCQAVAAPLSMRRFAEQILEVA
jgi:spore maturation protein CgeB